jgi:hypothetical protein
MCLLNNIDKSKSRKKQPRIFESHKRCEKIIFAFKPGRNVRKKHYNLECLTNNIRTVVERYAYDQWRKEEIRPTERRTIPVPA